MGCTFPARHSYSWHKFSPTLLSLKLFSTKAQRYGLKHSSLGHYIIVEVYMHMRLIIHPMMQEVWTLPLLHFLITARKKNSPHNSAFMSPVRCGRVPSRVIILSIALFLKQLKTFERKWPRQKWWTVMIFMCKPQATNLTWSSSWVMTIWSFATFLLRKVYSGYLHKFRVSFGFREYYPCHYHPYIGQEA